MNGVHGVRVLFAVFLLAACIEALAVAPSADALVTQQQAQDVASMVEDQSPVQVPGEELTPAGADLQSAAQVSTPTETTTDTLASELAQLEEEIGTGPEVKSLGQIILDRTPEGIAAGAGFYVGWQIGSKIYDFFSGGGDDDETTGAKAPTAATLVDRGDLFFQNGLTGEEVDAPTAGKLYSYQGTYFVYIRTAWPGYSCNSGVFWASGPRVNITEGKLVAGQSVGSNGGCKERTAVLFDPLRTGEGTKPDGLGSDPQSTSQATPWYKVSPPTTQQQLEDRVQDELDSGNYPQIEQLVNRCTAPPVGESVVVPQILPNELPEHYEDCLDSLGLEYDEYTLPETDPTYADGAVTEVAPSEGDHVSAGAQLHLAINPSVTKTVKANKNCEIFGKPQPDPGEPDPFTANPDDPSAYPQYRELTDLGSPYTLAIDPTPGGSRTTVPLRYGTGRWGWRHIVTRHGFTSADRQQTAEALATDFNPTPGFPATNQWIYHLPYQVDVDGEALQCFRTVIVEFWSDPDAATAGWSGIRGIFNSFVGSEVPEE